MNSIFRARSLASTNASALIAIQRTSIRLAPWRSYSFSAYGDDAESNRAKPTAQPTRAQREHEHPGPPPPNIPKSAGAESRAGSKSSAGQNARPASSIGGEPRPASSPTATAQHRPHDPRHLAGHPISKTPTNQARPTITTGQESPNVDTDGNPRQNVPEDVRRHNVELGERYDRSYNQIGDEGRIRKGF